jgi:hypothetical protein
MRLAQSTVGPFTPSRPVRRIRVAGALAVALGLSVGVVSAHAAADASARPAAADQAPARPSAACIREGLAPIPVTLRAGALYEERTGSPVFEVEWSGKPLAAGCRARRTVAIDFTLWFPHLRFVYTEGFPTHWLQFWSGRRVARSERERYSGPLYSPLECIVKARAKLRYEVVGSGGAVFGRRVVSVPVKLLPCSE